MALIAEKISAKPSDTIYNFLLVFYWPLTLSFFARRLKAAFEYAAEKRSEARITP